jgi:hypothetical protein
MPASQLQRRYLAVLAAAAALAGLPACGGGGSPVDPQQFRIEANQVCRDVEQQINRIQSTRPRTADQAEKQAAAIVDVSKQALGDLHRIDAPEDLKPTWDRYLAAREKAIGFIEQSRDAAARNDANAYARGKLRLAQDQPTRRALALRLGLNRCSRPSLPKQ